MPDTYDPIRDALTRLIAAAYRYARDEMSGVPGARADEALTRWPKFVVALQAAQVALAAGERGGASRHDSEISPPGLADVTSVGREPTQEMPVENRESGPLSALRARLAKTERKRDALRADVQEYEQLAALMRRREQPWIERWRQATGKHDSLPDYGAMLAWIVERTEQAEARAARLATTLEQVSGLLDDGWAAAAGNVARRVATERHD